MASYDEAIAALEARFGKIDNIKFLLTDKMNASVEDVLDDFAKAVSAVLEGAASPSSDFRDSVLANEKIAL